MFQPTYKYVNGQLRHENRGGHNIYYYYDSYGYLMAIRYYTTDSDSVIYYAATNAQGDVLGLYTGGGILCVTYEYDSWGNLISMTDNTDIGIGSINPIRYRGYYFDSETGLYYLQSRYYDPQVGRFINADDTEILLEDQDNLLQYSLFAYCFNNPVNMIDPDGFYAVALASGGYLATAGTVGLANVWNPIGWVILGVAAISTVAYVGHKIYKFAKSKRGTGRAKLKKQGREALEKKKQNSNWKKNSGKKSRAQPRPHHPSKKGHRKY